MNSQADYSIQEILTRIKMLSLRKFAQCHLEKCPAALLILPHITPPCNIAIHPNPDGIQYSKGLHKTTAFEELTTVLLSFALFTLQLHLCLHLVYLLPTLGLLGGHKKFNTL